jgi:hypothetical protein
MGILWGSASDGHRLYAATWLGNPGTLFGLNPATGEIGSSWRSGCDRAAACASTPGWARTSRLDPVLASAAATSLRA